MREHTHLPAMVGFVRKHVAQHFRAHRPGPSPAVSQKLLDAASTASSHLPAERFREHLCAASGALGQSRTGLLRRAARAVELPGNLQVRSREPDHLQRTLCMCVKMAAMVRTLFLPGFLPGGLAVVFAVVLAFQAAGSRCSMSI